MRSVFIFFFVALRVLLLIGQMVCVCFECAHMGGMIMIFSVCVCMCMLGHLSVRELFCSENNVVNDTFLNIPYVHMPKGRT